MIIKINHIVERVAMRIIKESDDARIDFLRHKIGILQNKIDTTNANYKIYDKGILDTLEGHLKRYSKELADLYNDTEK